MTSRNPIENLGQSLGEYLREQRTSARLSLRQLADLAGVSNPYLSQIERGVKKPSAEILQQLAKGLQISSESLYVKAGFLDERTVSEHRPWDVETAVTADPALTERQKSTLIDIYRSFVGEAAAGPAESTSDQNTPAEAPPKAPAKAPAKAPKRPTSKAAATGATTRKKTPQKSSTGKSSTSKTSTKKTTARKSTTDSATTARASRTNPKTTTTKE